MPGGGPCQTRRPDVFSGRQSTQSFFSVREAQMNRADDNR